MNFRKVDEMICQICRRILHPSTSPQYVRPAKSIPISERASPMQRFRDGSYSVGLIISQPFEGRDAKSSVSNRYCPEMTANQLIQHVCFVSSSGTGEHEKDSQEELFWNQAPMSSCLADDFARFTSRTMSGTRFLISIKDFIFQ